MRLEYEFVFGMIENSVRNGENANHWHLHLSLRVFFLLFPTLILFVAFVEDNATMSSIRYFENHVSYFVQNRRK